MPDHQERGPPASDGALGSEIFQKLALGDAADFIKLLDPMALKKRFAPFLAEDFDSGGQP